MLKSKPVNMKLFPYEINGDYRPLDDAVPWNVSLINALTPWPEVVGQAPVIAVVDTGADIEHPALKDRIFNPINFTSDGPSYDVTDYQGHGTHITGTIAGEGVGCYPGARIMPVKAFAKKTSGWEFQDAFRAILKHNEKAPEADKVVAVNCSWGGGYDPFLHYLIRRLVNQGTAVICSAGNAGDGDPETAEIFSWPAFLYEPITVGAVDSATLAAKYSSSYDGIDLAAPGSNIYSCWPGGGYKNLSGTSMAAPHVTALVARIYAAWKEREGHYPTTDEAESVLWRHVRKLDQDERLVGRGMADFTYDRKRWPLWRIQMGAYFYTDNADKIKQQLTYLRDREPSLAVPYKVKY